MVYPYIIKEYGTFKVGVFGLTTPETNLLSNIQPEAVMDTNFVGIAATTVAELQSENCNLIILLSHLGVACDSLVAENVPGINVIVGGHDHYKFNQPLEITNPGGTETYLVQAGSFYRYIGKMKFVMDAGNVTMTDYQLVAMDNTIPEDPVFRQEVNNMIATIEADYGHIYTQQIAEATGYFEEVADSLTAPGNHDTPAGDLITDAYRQTMGTDIALEAGGSIAQPIYQGPLTAIDLFRTVGYGFNEHNMLNFPLVTFDLTGADIVTGLEYCLTMVGSDDEFLPQVSGMSYRYNLSLPEFNRSYDVLVNGSPIDPTATYSITANWYLAYILQNEFGFDLQNYQEYPDSTEFQVLAAYVSALGTITPEVDGRIYTKTKEITASAPKEFQLLQNYPNPFNPDTKISYRIPEPGLVKLKIYNVLGQEVETLVNEYEGSGSHTVKWNASAVTSGVYFYCLEEGGRKMTKKMILLK
jgi:5'-nucleotidase/UDP-sugar diphosphatase